MKPEIHNVVEDVLRDILDSVPIERSKKNIQTLRLQLHNLLVNYQSYLNSTLRQEESEACDTTTTADSATTKPAQDISISDTSDIGEGKDKQSR